MESRFDYTDLRQMCLFRKNASKTDIQKFDSGSASPTQWTTTTFSYDLYGNMSSRDQKDDIGGSERYDSIQYSSYYDTNNWLLARPAVISVQSSQGGATLSTTSFVYDGASNRVLQKIFSYDGISDPVISYTYDNYGNVSTQTDPNGYVTQTTYDTATQTFPAIITNPLGQQGTISYDYRFGKPLQKCDPNCTLADPVCTNYTYDPLGRLTSVVAPYSAKYYTYNNLGAVGVNGAGQNVTVQAVWSSGAGGYYTTITYFDGLGRQIATRSDGPAQSGGSPSMVRVDTQYDINGRVYQKSYPYLDNNFSPLESPRYARYAYDNIGRLTQKYYTATGTSVTVAYSNGMASITDQNGKMSRQEQRDGFGRTTMVSEYLAASQGFATTYQYDSLGNLLFVTDAKGNTTGIVYDSLSRKVRMSDRAMGEWFYGYDKSGNLTSQTDSKGQTIHFQYDPLNRLWSKNYPNGTSITYSYDGRSAYNWYGAQVTNYGVGRLTEVVDNSPENSSGIVQFFYDKQGRTTGVIRTIDQNRYGAQFQYDQLGHITNIGYPDGDQVNYAYDRAGNMASVSNSSLVPYAVFSNYNAFGQVKNIAFNNGVNSTLSYDPATSRLSELSTVSPVSGQAQDFTYNYDNNGNIMGITDHVNSTAQTFTYDWLNRLSTANGPYGSLSYSPDATGDIANPEVASSRNEQTLTYDYDNRVTSVSTGGSTLASFVYDYTGARVKKISYGGTSITTYVNKLFEIRNGIITKHIFAGGSRIASITASNITYHHPDHIGSLNIATNSSGSVAQAVAYTPYGDVFTNTGSITQYLFTGQELDSETGLYYFGARYYDAAQGRFISPDTIVQSPGNPQTLNRYAYAGNNPLSFVDPTGHGFFSFLEDFFAALFGAAITALTWGAAGPVVAGMLGGMVAGGTDAAMHGASLIGIVQAGFMGGMMGAIGGGLYMAGVPWQVMAGAGAAIAGGTGGLNGLGRFAAGFAGGLAGGMLGGYLDKAINSNIAQASDYQSNMSQTRDMDKGDLPQLKEGPEWRSADSVRAESNSYSMGMQDYGGGVWNAWNAGDPTYAWLGQAVSIQAENVNILPTALTVTANGMSQSLWLGPLEVHEFNFSTFTSEPYAWTISASTSKWGVIYYKIQSTWVPGMPPNP